MVSLRGGFERLSDHVRAHIFRFVNFKHQQIPIIISPLYSSYLLAALASGTQVQTHYTDRYGRSTRDILSSGTMTDPAVEFRRIISYFPNEPELVSICKFWLIVWQDTKLRQLAR